MIHVENTYTCPYCLRQDTRTNPTDQHLPGPKAVAFGMRCAERRYRRHLASNCPEVPPPDLPLLEARVTHVTRPVDA